MAGEGVTSVTTPGPSLQLAVAYAIAILITLMCHILACLQHAKSLATVIDIDADCIDVDLNLGDPSKSLMRIWLRQWLTDSRSPAGHICIDMHTNIDKCHPISLVRLGTRTNWIDKSRHRWNLNWNEFKFSISYYIYNASVAMHAVMTMPLMFIGCHWCNTYVRSTDPSILQVDLKNGRQIIDSPA